MVTIEIPALRERREDIELLLEYFGKNFAEKYRIQWSGFTEAALRKLLNYPWPGNVRELRNLIERCVVLCTKGPIDVGDLPAEISAGGPSGRGRAEFAQLSYEEARAAFEREYLVDVLDRHAGNISQAAAAIGLHRQTLQYKLKQLGIRKTWSDG